MSVTGPLVTIGCAVYNGEATLARALSQVVAQDYANLEILIADDCSTDGSREIYEGFARNDSRIKIIRNAKNLGLAENLSRLALQASGRYFMWADQDDIRDKTFVSKAVAALEADPEAVLCHSHTGAFMGDPDDVQFVVTLHGVRGEKSRVRRYFNFLRYFSDTALYGLIRTDALKKTKLIRKDLGAANALLFDLLLRGKFIELPEVLYYYSARGMRNRPSAKEEYERMNPGKEKPLLYIPFLVVALNQTRDLGRSPLGWLEKVEIASVLWSHTAAVAATKLVYRSLSVPFNLPDSFTDFCDRIVAPQAHFEYRNNMDRDEELFPKAWFLKGGD